MKAARLAHLAFAAALVGCPSATPPIDPQPDAQVEETAEWKPVLEHLGGALLSIWGTSERDVWTVGGALGNGGEPLVLHYDGTSWKRFHPGGTETFWWVHGTSATDVWFVGEKGRITHWDGAKLEERPSGTTATLFGLWAASPDDAWAVGGVPDGGAGPNDVVLHWDGSAWKPEKLPEEKKVALFKVWGTSKDDVYVVGELGVVWHRTGGSWTREAEGVAKGRLTTINGCSTGEIFAVGGRELLTKAGETWTRSETLLVNDVNGVACAPAGAPSRPWGRAVVVGGGSLKLRLVGTEWKDDFGTVPFTDLHGAWVDPTGAFWGVGGSFLASARPGASREGVVARYGLGAVSAEIEP